jgi:hypothetical protein
MPVDLTKLLDTWVYDIDRILRSQRDDLKDDLSSDDENVREHAIKEIDQIHGWLYLPVSASGRSRGRPRDEASQHAIRALGMHLATPRSWREIALAVKGCKHWRPRPGERSCDACGDAIRKSAERLKKFLKSKGCDVSMPRRVELEAMSIAELRKLWKVHD